MTKLTNETKDAITTLFMLKTLGADKGLIHAAAERVAAALKSDANFIDALYDGLRAGDGVPIHARLKAME